MEKEYNYIKKKYKNYIVLIYKDNKYYSYDRDKRILDFINFNNKLPKLRKYSISFIVLDEEDMIGMANYLINNYYIFLFISYIGSIIRGKKNK